MPHQTARLLTSPGMTSTDTDWPRAVFDRERSYPGRGREVARGFVSAAASQSIASRPLVEVAFVEERPAQKFILRGQDLRRRLEQAYNSLGIPPPRP